MVNKEGLNSIIDEIDSLELQRREKIKTVYDYIYPMLKEFIEIVGEKEDRELKYLYKLRFVRKDFENYAEFTGHETWAYGGFEDHKCIIPLRFIYDENFRKECKDHYQTEWKIIERDEELSKEENKGKEDWDE